MCGRYYGTGFVPMSEMDDYPNLLGITPAYNIDWGDSFGKKTVYIKTPMRLEDFDMAFSEDFIRSNIQVHIIEDPITKDYKITASLKLSNGLEFKATGHVSHFAATVEKYAIQNMENRVTDVVVLKAKTYNEGRIVRENMMNMKNMSMYAMSDEICEHLGLTTKTPDKKSKWIEGIPAVKKVETYNSRVVKVTFIDGTYTKAICSENDNFDLDVGITICAMKRLLGTSSENATREYNRFMNHAHAVMDRDVREKAETKAKKEADKAKKRKIELKRAAKKLKAKEEQIDIQKQAIIRAHQEMEGLEQ